MSPKLWWYVARSSGIVAWALLTLSVLWGLFVSTRLLGKRPTPAWLLDLHRFLGGIAVIFTGLHLTGLFADTYVHFGPSELFVPFASRWHAGAVAWGVVASYILIAIELTSLAMRRLPRALWKQVHRSSFVLYVMATIHGLTAGTDTKLMRPAALLSALIASLLILFVWIVKVLSPRRSLRKKRPPARPAPAKPIREGTAVPG